MTTLPTRPNGGIDWEKTYNELWNFKGELAYKSREELMKLAAKTAAAHERERCAKVAKDLGHKNYNGHDIAAALRKLED